MKTLKKIMAVVLASLMIAALCIPALADSGTITIENAVKGTTYDVYQIFDATYVEYTEDGETLKHVAYSYTDKGDSENPDPFLTALKAATSIFTVTARTGEPGVYNVSMASGASAADVTAWINSNVALITIDANKKGSNTADTAGTLTVASNLPYGYYYFNTTTGGTATITSAVPSVTVKDKNTRPGPGPVDPDTPSDGNRFKSIVTEDGEATENHIELGDTVDFRLALSAANYYTPAGETEAQPVLYYIAHDKADANFEVDTSSIKVYVNGLESTDLLASSAYTVTTTGLSDGCTFEVNIPWAAESATEAGVMVPIYPEQSDVYVTYSATLLNTAADDTAVTNEGWFTSDEWTPAETSHTETDTYTHFATLVKTDASDAVLTGASFLLYDSADGTTPIDLVSVAGGYRIATDDDTTTVTAISAGNVKISGLGAGTYYLEETAAPTGYNPIETRVSFTITDSSIDADVIPDGATGALYATEDGTTPLEFVAIEGGYRLATSEDAAEDKVTSIVISDTVEISGLTAGTSYWFELAGETAREEIELGASETSFTKTSDVLLDGGVQVINQTGGTLPETGGIGTTIFYVLGGLLAVGAAVLLITKKRLGADR